MAFTKGLYYPTIEVQDEDWLRSAALYWDNIQTIVPESIQKPYASRISKALNDEGILIPFVIKSSSSIVRNLADSALKFIQTNEAQQLFLNKSRSSYRIHRDKLPKQFRIHQDKLPEEFRMHSDKLSYFLRDRLKQRIDNDGWFNASYGFAEFYMSLLANEICETKRLALLSDNSFASNLAEKAKLDNMIVGKNFDLFSKRTQSSTISLAEGQLTSLIIQGVKLRPGVSIKKIIEFKGRYKDELGLFRTNIGKLIKDAPADSSFDALRQYVNDVYINEFLPSLNALGKALTGSRIKWNFETLVKVSLISVAATSTLPLLGLTIPQALFSAVGLSIIGNKIVYNIDKRQKILENPYSYLMLADRKLNADNFQDFIRKTIF